MGAVDGEVSAHAASGVEARAPGREVSADGVVSRGQSVAPDVVGGLMGCDRMYGAAAAGVAGRLIGGRRVRGVGEGIPVSADEQASCTADRVHATGWQPCSS